MSFNVKLHWAYKPVVLILVGEGGDRPNKKYRAESIFFYPLKVLTFL